VCLIASIVLFRPDIDEADQEIRGGFGVWTGSSNRPEACRFGGSPQQAAAWKADENGGVTAKLFPLLNGPSPRRSVHDAAGREPGQ
jgi:hypothetical protein